MPKGGRGAQGVPQGMSHMPSIPFADPAVASSSSSAQQAGRPFQSAEIMPSAPISMDSVFTSSQVLPACLKPLALHGFMALACPNSLHVWLSRHKFGWAGSFGWADSRKYKMLSAGPSLRAREHTA